LGVWSRLIINCCRGGVRAAVDRRRVGGKAAWYHLGRGGVGGEENESGAKEENESGAEEES
jgi:hypothetical protein